MPRVRMTLTLDADIVRLVEVSAARRGVDVGDVIEQALRRDLGLPLLDGIWARNRVSDSDAMSLAVTAQHATRPKPG